MQLLRTQVNIYYTSVPMWITPYVSTRTISPATATLHTDGRQRPFKAHIQQRGDERARPRTGSGQGYRNEYEKSPEAVRLNGLGLSALVFDKGRQLIENMVLFHPFYHFGQAG